jgi:DAK2 domain fusion protein YloV
VEDAPFLDWFARFRDHLGSERSLIDSLNVYPVPDGDTGSNMLATVESMMRAMGEAGDCDRLVAAEKGALLGARGNSGIILSQILRAVSATAREMGRINGEYVAVAFERADAAARAAVAEVVEGTMLTATRAAAEGARAPLRGSRSASALDAAVSARTASLAALRKTPELLPILAQSGVVDSGACGVVLLVDALVDVLGGECLGRLEDHLPETVVKNAMRASPVAPAPRAPADDLRYEVMFLLEGDEAAVEGLKGVWAGLGGSIAIVGGEGLYNCHIHTNDIGAVIEAGIDAGRVRDIRVVDLREQVGEERWVRQAEQAGAVLHGAEEITPPRVNCGVVAVAVGEGFSRIFYSFGAQRVVRGGQAMNPSTGDVLEAIEATNASSVVVLPNNKNVIAVAREAAALASKPTVVVATESMPEGVAALVVYDPEADVEANASAMEEAARNVVVGEVTQAVRPAASPAGPVRKGDYIGMTREGIQVVSPSLVGAVCGLISKLATPEHELLTIYEGQGASASTTREIEDFVVEELPALGVEIHHGGQPFYPYLISLE